MKLAGAEASRFLAKPDPNRAGLLIFGADTMRVALKRQEAIAALIGPQGEAEMRLTRIQAADLRKNAALLEDATRAIGFFPGPTRCTRTLPAPAIKATAGRFSSCRTQSAPFQ